MKIEIRDIIWDTDGQDVDLPTEVTVDTIAAGIDNPDEEASDYLSDEYGWTVTSFTWNPAETPKP